MFDGEDQVIYHPIMMLELLRVIEPELKDIRNIYPWIRAQQEKGISFRELVKQYLLSLGIEQEHLDDAIAAIRSI